MHQSLGINDKCSTILAMNIAILALDGTFDTGLAAFQDTLTTAAELAPTSESKSFKATVLSVRHGAMTAHGLAIPAVPAVASFAPDLVLVPAVGAKTEEALSTTPAIRIARALAFCCARGINRARLSQRHVQERSCWRRPACWMVGPRRRVGG